MNFLRLSYGSVVAAFFTGVLVLAQEPPEISVAKVMTEAEMTATGVATLKPAQRDALDRWLSAYTMSVIQVVQGAAKGRAASTNAAADGYSGVAGGHWIKSKSSSGSMIVLEDGSVWEINAMDRIDTALWLPITNITVLKASSRIGEYVYILVNKDDGEKALAKFLGKE